MTTDFDPVGQDRPQLFVSDAPSPREARGMRVRLWIIGILAALAIGVFGLGRFMALVKPSIDRMQQSTSQKRFVELKERIVMLFDSYGVYPEWIRRRTVTDAAGREVREEWNVRVPADLSLASMNADITNLAIEYGGKAIAVEDGKTGQVAVHVQSDGRVRYTVHFTPSRDIRRAGGTIALLVDGIDDAPSSAIDAFIANREPVGVIISPDRDVADAYERLRMADCDVILHIHLFATETDKSRYSLSEDMPPDAIRRAIRRISRQFRGARYFFITTDRAAGSLSRSVGAGFLASGFTQIDPADLNYIDRTSENQTVTSRMNDLAATALKQRVAIGVLQLQDGTMEFLKEEVGRLRKKGFDFVDVKDISARVGTAGKGQ